MDFMKSHYNDEKLDKSNELNSSMTINETTQADEYTQKLQNLGGNV
jgi:hypothetical protein|nr:MAG TPA: hypothetical protein [Bacteriophage sp.]DAX97962.1 MAG TPA: hypothetical protein [Bacteriophage sp.]